MPPTRLTDIIEPEVFAAYMREAIIERSALIRSGMIIQDTRLDDLVSGGGRTINMPIWARLGGRSVVSSDTVPLDPQGIGTKKDVATMHLRDGSWGASELASAIAGDSAISAIAAQLAEWWDREEQQILLSSLIGIFDSPSMATHIYDERINDVIDARMVIRARQLLGDAKAQLAMMFMHSMTETVFEEQDLFDYVPKSEQGDTELYRTYRGMQVVVDDTIPVAGDTYSTFITARGVVGRGDGNPVDRTAVETDRDAALGIDILIHRRSFALHPLGIAWKGDAAGTTPTDAELRTGTNWERVYDKKHIGFIEIKHKV
jgi:hypothetical protein